MSTSGLPLELYYIDGRPDGMLTAEMFNWTGHVLMTPRTQLSEALTRQEARYAGVYLLLGEKDGEARAYIGEGEDISDRIKSHDVNKDWWTSAILVTAAGNKLNKAHARYLEARLIEEAKRIGRTPLENGTAPARPGLSEADIAKMEAFLENLFIVLPAVRVDMFVQRARKVAAVGSAVGSSTAKAVVAPPLGGTRFIAESRKHGLTAHAVLQNGELVVLAGSEARLQWEGKEKETSGYARLHEELRRSGVLAPNGDRCVFTTDYAFSSPSAAACVVKGRSTNGATTWRVESTGQTYKEWEADHLRHADAAA